MSDAPTEDVRNAEENQSNKAGNATESEAVANASRLTRFFFLKTTFGILLTTLFVVGGVMAYFSLVKESLPDLDIPNATITTTWPGADPTTIEEQVTQEIEDELTTLADLKSINSASFDSFSLISVEFDASADSGEAIARLREKIADAEANLPDEAEKPTVEQVSVDDRPVLTVALYGDAGPAAFSALGEDLQDRLERIGGVNEVSLSGVQDEIVQVLLEPQRLLALGLSPVEVRNAIPVPNLNSHSARSRVRRSGLSCGSRASFALSTICARSPSPGLATAPLDGRSCSARSPPSGGNWNRRTAALSTAKTANAFAPR